MNIYRKNQQLPREKSGLVTVGTFDGVHLGHQTVLRNLVGWAGERGLPSGVITFGQHPRKVLDGRGPELLTTLEHRLVLFERAGVTFAWVLDFTKELSQLTAEAFARKYFIETLSISGLVMGFDSRFGCDRMGSDSPQLEPLGEKFGFEVRCVPAIAAPQGSPVSSTLIREAIWEGRLRDAETMLGRRVSVLGTVIQGAARGRRLGYRTANIDLDREVRPPFGVYATICQVGTQMLGSITNVGYRPTIEQNLADGEKPDLLLESHILDFSEDLYGQRIEVHFIEKLRDERRFPDVQSLVLQIKQDELRARGILQAHGII